MATLPQSQDWQAQGLPGRRHTAYNFGDLATEAVGWRAQAGPLAVFDATIDRDFRRTLLAALAGPRLRA